MTDLYPSEEGYISDGYVLGYCKCQAAVEYHDTLYIHGTAVSGTISVAPTTVDSTGVAIALKAGEAGDYIPVCFFGVVKLMAADTLTVGDCIISDALGTYVLPLPNVTATAATKFRGLNNSGTLFRLGFALQNATASGDEFLALIGRII